MLILDINSNCPKCGNENASTKYCPGVENTEHLRGCDVTGEHLHRTCAKCGFSWVEPTADAAQTEVKLQGDMNAR